MTSSHIHIPCETEILARLAWGKIAVQAWETGLLVTPVSEGLENMILEHMGSLVSTVSRRRILDTWFLEILPNDKNGHDMFCVNP